MVLINSNGENEEIRESERKKYQLAKTWEDDVKKMRPEDRSYLLKNYENQLQEIDECLHYARQDWEYLTSMAGADLTNSERRQQAQHDVEFHEKEMEDLKSKISFIRSC